VEQYRTTNLDHEAVRIIQQQVNEQVLQEKNTFLEQELLQRRRLVRCILVFVVTIILIIASAAVVVVLIQKANKLTTCVKWLQNEQVGKYVASLIK